MKQIVYGTKNPAKVAQIQDVLAPIDIEVKSLADFPAVPNIEENGVTVEDNARIKATAYAKALHQTVLSMDIGLYFDNVPDEQQPGQYVRRISGNDRATDEELIKHYSKLIQDAGGETKAYWRYAFALASADEECVSFTSDSAPRYFVSTPAKTITPGFPLESLQIDPESGTYFSDMTWGEKTKAAQATDRNEKLKQFMLENYN